MLSVALITAVAGMYFSGVESLKKWEADRKGNFHYVFKDVPVNDVANFKNNRKKAIIFFALKKNYSFHRFCCIWVMSSRIKTITSSGLQLLLQYTCVPVVVCGLASPCLGNSSNSITAAAATGTVNNQGWNRICFVCSFCRSAALVSCNCSISSSVFIIRCLILLVYLLSVRCV